MTLESWHCPTGGANDKKSLEIAVGFFKNLSPQVNWGPILVVISQYAIAFIDFSFAFANEFAISTSIGINASELITKCNTGYPRSQIPTHQAWGYCLTKDLFYTDLSLQAIKVIQ